MTITSDEIAKDPFTRADAASTGWLLWAAQGLRSVAPWLAASFFGESDRWFLWSPVLLGFGVTLYFGLPFEPPLWAALVALGLSGAVLFPLRHKGASAVLIAAIVCISIGFFAATLRAWSVDAPVLEKTWTGELTGRLLETERTQKGALSVLIAPLAMQGLPGEAMPARVRLSIRMAGVDIAPGETLRLRGRLLPPPEPVEPGGFDYARQVWFQSLGGVGYAFTAPVVVAPAPGDWATWLTALRAKITTRVQTGIGGAAGAISAALITGEQRSIPQQAIEDLRNAGLSHVLSISGLHMVLFGGSLFWLVRAGLALAPALALRFPIKKWGAAAALLGATGYLLISGAEVATQRSYIMIALMFVAILLDRPALSMRNVALAAIIVLLWQPESLLGASFHMSFAAVVALIAFYESPVIQRLTTSARGRGDGYFIGLVRFAANHVVGILLTTTIAGFATGAYAAFHFDRVAIYGMAGNMGALPIVSVVVMPAALAVLVLMPFGLDGPALWVMGKGVDAMLWVAHIVSSWNGADRMIATAPMASLILVTLGGLWLALWNMHWRWLGAAPLILGLALWGADRRPDILIDRDGGLVAIRTSGGALALTSARPDYTAEQWLRHDGDERSPAQAVVSRLDSNPMRCDALGCIWSEQGGPVIALPKTLEALAEDCRKADIVIAPMGLPRRMRAGCGAAHVIDFFDLWRNGAAAFHIEPDGTITRETSRALRGDRPWVQRTKAAKAFEKLDAE